MPIKASPADKALDFEEIFNGADQLGICVIKVKFDAFGTPIDYRFLETNASFERISGLSDVKGRWMRDISPTLNPLWYEQFGLVARTGQSIKIERQVASGRWFDLQGFRIGGEDERKVAVIFSDTTDKMRVEEDLKRNELRFRTLAEAIPNQVWTAKPDGLLDWFNSRVYEYSGMAEGELDGENWAKIVHPDDLAAAANNWRAALATHEGYETEFRLRRADGEQRWHIARAVPLLDELGSVVQWIGTNTDIHDQRNTVEALRESEARLQLAIDAGGLAVWEIDLATNSVTASAGLNRLYGFPEDARPTIDEYQSRYASGELERLNAVGAAAIARGETGLEAEVKHVWPDGTEKWLLIRANAAPLTPRGSGPRAIGVVVDVTDRKEAELRQQMLMHELSHRIKNILAMVSAIASQTLRSPEAAGERAAFLERLRALSAAHDVLTQTNWTAASLASVVGAATASLPHDRLHVNGPPVILSPKQALSMAVAVNELITNASKYGSLSSDNGTVRISWNTGSASELVHWEWIEDGGPPVAPPTRKGFGTYLIERVLGADFDGAVVLTYEASGLRCVLTTGAGQRRRADEAGDPHP